MKRLILMRHAKSSWESGAMGDHDRPLNERGRRDATRVGQYLRQRNWLPDIILSSDARRTVETYECMMASLGGDTPVHLLAELYLSGREEIAENLGEHAQRSHIALLLGHNPGWTEATRYFSGAAVDMKTANAAVLESRTDSDWAELCSHPSRFALIDHISPKEI